MAASVCRVCLPLIIMITSASSDPSRIRLNQIGFYPEGPKTAIVVSPESWNFSIRSPDGKTIFYNGELSAPQTWTASGEKVSCADFSSFKRYGRYVVYVAGIGASYPFSIVDRSLEELTRGLLRGFYFQRASTALQSSYATLWNRAAGHPDTRVKIHASAASDQSKPGARKEGESYSSPKGWYDAGDYGKYVVNAGISTYQLLLLYEQFPSYFDRFNLNIPESGNRIPDILDEIKWELDWLLTMQDPADSGVYHKLTSKTFCGDLMPAEDRDVRYFIGKGSAATCDFAAVCAVASRVYQKYLPSFADSCRSAAKAAWNWGAAHPDSTYKNPPDVVTGEYGNTSLGDERQWAAYELFITTGDSAFFKVAATDSLNPQVPDWSNVRMLGHYSMALRVGDPATRKRILTVAQALLDRTRTLPYRTSISSEFYWGSNSVAANQGMCMMAAYLLTKDISFLVGAIHSCDYLMGRNAVGSSFVTGFGARSPQRPHHRPSTADNVGAPVPGLLVGGPNAQAGGEGCTEPYATPKAQKWLDNACSYTTNEIAINWNSAAAFLAGAIDAVIGGDPSVRQTLLDYFSPDTTPPQALTITLSGIRADHAEVSWKTRERASVNVSWRSTSTGERRIVCGRADSGRVTLGGLLPATVYFVKCIAIDTVGNTIAVADSFRTENSLLDAAALHAHSRGTCAPVAPFTVTLFHPQSAPPLDARLRYTEGGTAATDSVSFTPAGDSLIATIPASRISANGLTYSIIAFSNGDTLTTALRSIAPDTMIVTDSGFSIASTYRLTSLPGLYAPRSPATFLLQALGDTSNWRYFGYAPGKSTYIPFDSLTSGHGGWLYHKRSCAVSWTTGGIVPDTLFPLVLGAGWNCIGNPFPYPILWDNSLVGLGDAVVSITDPAAVRMVRRQFFTYTDTQPDNRNNGTYPSNRKLDSFKFDTTARLSPWNGYWMYAERDSVTLLLNPSAVRSAAALGKKSAPEADGWLLTIEMTSGASAPQRLVLGVSEAARDGYDQFDSPRPPAIAPGLAAEFRHPEWRTASPSYVADIAGSRRTESYQWPLTISFTDQRKVALSWRPSGTIDGALRLIDPITGADISVEDNSGYSFEPLNGETSRQLTFIRSSKNRPVSVTHSGWSFSQIPGPIPAFTYAVPSGTGEASMVSIAVYDIRGRRVSTLLHASRYPGVYRIVWLGEQGGPCTAARGAYIARITGGSFSKSIRVNLTR
jgi:endoglucanase